MAGTDYYVFRITPYGGYQEVRAEALAGKLRQGWGHPGLDVRQGRDSFVQAYLNLWENETEKRASRKYTAISNILNMKPGDLIVTPKLSMDTDDQSKASHQFTLFQVTSDEYSFEPLTFDGDYKDFGHTIPVKPLCSYAYGLNAETRVISASFRSYQDPIVHVGSQKVKGAIDQLVKDYKADPEADRSSTVRSIEAFMAKAEEPKQRYLSEILNVIRAWSGHEFELVIRNMLSDAGYLIEETNDFDRKGGDVDIAIQLYPGDSVVATMLSAADADIVIPQLRIQAKNKYGVDERDIKGVQQLLNKEGWESSVNVLMSTCDSFTDEAKELAQGKVVLIDGPRLAAMLAKYVLASFDMPVNTEA